MTGIEIKIALAAFLLAFGIAAPVPDFLSGMVIAIGASYGVMIVLEPTSRLSLWGTLFLGVLGAMFAAIFHQHLIFLRDLPVAGVMGGAGALSKPLAEAVISFGNGLKARAGRLPSEWKFPGSNGGGDEK